MKVLVNQLSWVILKAQRLPLKLSFELPPVDCSFLDYSIISNIISIGSHNYVDVSETLPVMLG